MQTRIIQFDLAHSPINSVLQEKHLRTNILRRGWPSPGAHFQVLVKVCIILSYGPSRSILIANASPGKSSCNFDWNLVRSNVCWAAYWPWRRTSQRNKSLDTRSVYIGWLQLMSVVHELSFMSARNDNLSAQLTLCDIQFTILNVFAKLIHTD